MPKLVDPRVGSNRITGHSSGYETNAGRVRQCPPVSLASPLLTSPTSRVSARIPKCPRVAGMTFANG